MRFRAPAQYAKDVDFSLDASVCSWRIHLVWVEETMAFYPLLVASYDGSRILIV